jgi:hypothetical protein
LLRRFASRNDRRGGFRGDGRGGRQWRHGKPVALVASMRRSSLPLSSNPVRRKRSAIQSAQAAVYARCMEAETSLIGKAIFAVYQGDAKVQSGK